MSSTQTTQEDILPEQILQAALQLYQKHGLKKVTMDDVSKSIGKTRGVLYYYYKNKDEIFEAVMDALIHEVITSIKSRIDDASSIEGKIKAFCLAKIKTSEEKKSFFTAIEAGMDADEISNHTKIMSDMHKRLMSEETSLLKKVLSTSAKNKEIRALKPKEQGALIFVLLSSVRGIKREIAVHENGTDKLNISVNILTDMIVQWISK